MSTALTTIMIVTLVCLADIVQGQKTVQLINGNVYIYPQFKKNNTHAIRYCARSGAHLPSFTNNETKTVAKTRNAAVWIDNAQGECEQMVTSTGFRSLVNCSLELPTICVAPAWEYTTIVNGSVIGFSNVLIRINHTEKICSSEKMGALVTIKSQTMQTAIEGHLNGSSYFISGNNKNANATNGFSNWGNQTNMGAEGADCIQVTGNGSWSYVDCNTPNRFICEWTAPVPTTTEPTMNWNMTTAMTAENTTTAGSNLIGGSIVLNLAVAMAINILTN